MTVLAFIDCETTNLQPRGWAWEIGMILRDPSDEHNPEWEKEWQIPVDLDDADPNALRIGRFYQRYDADNISYTDPRRCNPSDLACILDGVTLVGSNPSFDAFYLDKYLRANGQVGTWSHRMIDIPSLVAGKLGRIVGGLTACADALGVKYEKDQVHTALGDVRLARDCFVAVMGGAA